MSVHLKKKIQFYGFSSTAITDVKKKPVLYADGFSEIQVKGLWIGRTLQGSYLKLLQNVYIFGTRCYLLLKFAFQKKIQFLAFNTKVKNPLQNRWVWAEKLR